MEVVPSQNEQFGRVKIGENARFGPLEYKYALINVFLHFCSVHALNISCKVWKLLILIWLNTIMNSEVA